MRYDLVVFDLDGTLVDSAGDITNALNFALHEVGLPVYPEVEVRRMIGNGLHVLVERAVGAEQRALVPEVVTIYRRRYEENPVARTRLYPGVAEGLALAPSVVKSVATNKLGGQARKIVELLGVAPLLSAVLGEDDVGVAKPDPRAVELLRERAGGAPRERTLYVGDSLVDGETARAAGVDLCLVTYGYADKSAIRDFPARHHVDRFSDVVKLYT